MEGNLIAKSIIVVNTPVEKVWDALTNPEIISKYMPGESVVSDWKEGSLIVWKGEREGKPYEDKGIVLKIEPGKILQYSRYTLSPDVTGTPENHHIVNIELAKEGYRTQVWLSQDNNKNLEEQNQNQAMWTDTLQRLKKVLEKQSWEQ